MTANPIDLVGGLTTTANVAKADISAWAKARVSQVLADVTELRNTVLAAQLTVILKSTGAFLFQDTTDTTTADDGINCIISSDGFRFKPKAALLPPTAVSLGGVFSHAAVTHVFVTGINTDGTLFAAQPAITDLSSGTSAQLAAVVSDETGSGALVFANTPTMITPVLGVASATSINKVALTAPATGATLTIPDGVTLTGPAASGTAMTLGNVETVTGTKTFNASKLVATSPTFTTPLLGTPTSGVLTNCTGLPLAGLVTQAAFTFVGNNTSGSAVPTAVDIAALTAKTTPASTDLLMLSDQAASGAWKKSTLAQVVGALASGVSSIAGNTGAFTLGGLLSNATNLLQVLAAAKSDQQAGTSNILAVTPLHQQDHPSAAKVWVNFTPGASPTINASYNVTSVTQVATGKYTVNFTTAFASASYVAHPCSVGTTGGINCNMFSQASGSCVIEFYNSSGTLADPLTTGGLVCFGAQ